MKNKSFSVFLFLLVSLLMPGVTLFTFTFLVDGETKEARAAPIIVQDTLQKDTEILQKALEEKNLETCHESSAEQNCRDEVLYLIAVSEKKFEKCQEIQSTLLEKKCEKNRDQELYSNAMSISDCSKIALESLKMLCTEKFSVKKKSQSMSPEECEKISAKEEKKYCLRLSLAKALETSKDFSVCKKFSGAMNEECKKKMNEKIDRNYQKLAVEQGKISICKKILSETIKNDCENNAAYQAAWTQKDVRYCKIISDEDISKSCREDYGVKIDLFWLSKAVREENSTLCKKIVETDLLGECKKNFEKTPS